MGRRARRTATDFSVVVHGSALRFLAGRGPRPADIDVLVIRRPSRRAQLRKVSSTDTEILRREASELGKRWAETKNLGSLPVDVRFGEFVGIPDGVEGPHVLTLRGDKPEVRRMRELTSLLRLSRVNPERAVKLFREEILSRPANGYGGSGLNLPLSSGLEDPSCQPIRWYGGEGVQAAASALRHMSDRFAAELGTLGEILLRLRGRSPDELYAFGRQLADARLVSAADCDCRIYLRCDEPGTDQARLVNVMSDRSVELEKIRDLL